MTQTGKGEAMCESAYKVEVLEFEEYERGSLEGEPTAKTAYVGTLAECMAYWEHYASGLNDLEYPCSQQDFSKARFYRILGS